MIQSYSQRSWPVGIQAYRLFIDLLEYLNPASKQLNPLEEPFKFLALIRCLSFLRLIEKNGCTANPMIVGATLSIALKVVDLRTFTQDITNAMCFLIFRRTISPNNTSQVDYERKLLLAEAEVLRHIGFNVFQRDSSFYCQMLMPSNQSSSEEWDNLIRIVVHEIINLSLDPGMDTVIGAQNRVRNGEWSLRGTSIAAAGCDHFKFN